MGLFDFFKKNEKQERPRDPGYGPTLNEPARKPREVTHSYTFNIGDFDAGILVADLSPETTLPRGVRVYHENPGIRIGAPDKESADQTADILGRALNQLMSRTKIMRLASSTPAELRALEKAISSITPPPDVSIRFLQERAVITAQNKEQAEEWFQKTLAAMTALLPAVAPSATQDPFDAIHDQIEKQIQSGELNTALAGLHEFLRHSPGHEIALELAAIAMHQGMRRDTPEPIKPELAAAHDFDPIFAQCDICGACWVPDPSADNKPGNRSAPGLIAGSCPQCRQVVCCRHFQQEFSCPMCDCELEPMTDTNGRACILLLNSITELTPDEAVGKKHAVIVGSGFKPCLEDIELIEGAGYLSRAVVGLAVAGSQWEDSEQGHSQALTIWQRYNESLGIDMGRSRAEDLTFEDGRCFYIFKHSGPAERAGGRAG